MSRGGVAALVHFAAPAAHVLAVRSDPGPAPPPPDPAPVVGPSVELLDLRLVDEPGPDGKPRKVVYVDWRSVGPVPVRRVTATVTALGVGPVGRG